MEEEKKEELKDGDVVDEDQKQTTIDRSQETNKKIIDEELHLSEGDRMRRARRKSVFMMFEEEEVIRFRADEEVDENATEEEWSYDHARLPYLVSKFAMCALDPNEKEGWIRQLSLLVLMFEVLGYSSLLQ